MNEIQKIDNLISKSKGVATILLRMATSELSDDKLSAALELLAFDLFDAVKEVE